MGEEIAVENGLISGFQGLVTLTWIGSYCTPSCITYRPLPTCRISLKSKNPISTYRSIGLVSWV